MLIARSLSTLHHDTAPIHVCLPPRRTWPAVVFLMPTWAILKGFAYCLPYPKICLMPEMFAHISLTMYIGSVFVSCIVSPIFAKRNVHLRKYTLRFSEQMHGRTDRRLRRTNPWTNNFLDRWSIAQHMCIKGDR